MKMRFNSLLNISNIGLILILPLSGLSVSGCAIVSKSFGSGIDQERFDAARTSKMYEALLASATKQAERLEKNQGRTPDVRLFVREAALQEITNAYVGAQGKADENTSYRINKIDVGMQYGRLLAHAELDAVNSKYKAGCRLIMDCLMTIESENGSLKLRLEPFNITPIVSSIYSKKAERVLEDIIKVNVANIGKSLPQPALPLEFSNSFTAPEGKFLVHNKVNLEITNKPIKLDYKLKVLAVNFFDGYAVIEADMEAGAVK